MLYCIWVSNIFNYSVAYLSIGPSKYVSHILGGSIPACLKIGFKIEAILLKRFIKTTIIGPIMSFGRKIRKYTSFK